MEHVRAKRLVNMVNSCGAVGSLQSVCDKSSKFSRPCTVIRRILWNSKFCKVLLYGHKKRFTKFFSQNWKACQDHVLQNLIWWLLLAARKLLFAKSGILQKYGVAERALNALVNSTIRISSIKKKLRIGRIPLIELLFSSVYYCPKSCSSWVSRLLNEWPTSQP